VASLRDKILAVVRSTPGLTDREITDRLLGTAAAQQGINQMARSLTAQGLLERRPRHDGKSETTRLRPRRDHHCRPVSLTGANPPAPWTRSPRKT
jgi:hypothetical protein